ncbi:hypothetical protein [Chitinophaga alhagiae]|uniref:hypothetical protein n=1 Tax=Chitinophaga alhagiae TaxID=2203219 RepID=UPI0018E53DCD|nr:hypothetical protein [Chitinophaga alhagiae]
MKYFIPFLLLPSLLYGQQQQPVEPVLSADYLSLVKKEPFAVNALYDSSLQQLNLRRGYYFRNIRKVKVSGGHVSLRPLHYTTWRLSGNFSTAVELRRANRQPALQNTYAQGRAENGALAWRGAETGELFSYGPALAALAYDGGGSYPYDANGRLVAAGTGNGRPPVIYDNGIFRTASSLSQSLSLRADARNTSGATWEIDATLGRSRENTFLVANRNSTDHLSAAVKRHFGHFSVTGGYRYQRSGFSHGNRTGYLNRAYMNALLTPAGFSNRYSGLPYGNGAHNPYWLLERNPNAYGQTQQRGHLVLDYRYGRATAQVTQAYGQVSENGHEAYPAGLATQRRQRNGNYYLRADAAYPVRMPRYAMRSSINAYHIFTDSRANMQYQPQQRRYAFQRSANQTQLRYYWEYDLERVQVDAEAGNTFYFSNTAARARQFSPLLNVHTAADIFHRRLRLDVYGSLQAGNSELPVNSALGYTNLLQYPVGGAAQYFPLTEATGYDGLRPVRSRSYSTKAMLTYRRLSLTAEWFSASVQDDVFPLYRNGQLQLANVAAHRKRGIELTLGHQSASGKKAGASNTISLLRYRHQVTNVAAAAGPSLPIAGFADVHKALVKGAAMGAIMGNSYLRTAEGKIVIGADGFPLVNEQLRVIGNPIPDFVVKVNHQLHWKKLSLNASWEWKKGGDAWNGTQAVLDYYGRSAGSAAARNMTGYVFDGVLENGHPNNQPVSFYDPARPLEHNRWVRYGPGGVAEAYIQDASWLRLNTLRLGYRWSMGKIVRELHLSAYATNILLWSPYKGADPGQLLFDQPNTAGLDFFNLPSVRTYGFNASLQF